MEQQACFHFYHTENTPLVSLLSGTARVNPLLPRELGVGQPHQMTSAKELWASERGKHFAFLF